MIQYIYGIFKSVDDSKTFTVEIGDNTVTDPSQMLEIGIDNSTAYITDADSIYFGDDPVHITMDFDDTFKHVITRSCTIDLVTNMDLSSIMTSFFSDDIPVTVSYESTILFSGYVEPLTFDQGFARHWETYTLQCKDKLSISEFIKYPTVLPNTTINTTYYKFTDIINYIKTGLHLGNVLYDSHITTLQSYMNTTKVSQYSFFGESQNDYKTCQEVLEAIGVYWSVWFLQIGNDLRVFDWHNIWDSSNSNTLITIGQNDYQDNKTNISIADAYNQIILNCNIEETDELITDPFDSDYIYSTYPKYTRYLTEHFWAGAGWPTKSLQSMSNIVQGLPSNYNKYSTRDNYAWIKKNDLWRFPLRNGANYLSPSTQIQSLAWLKNNPMNAGFIAWGKADKPDAKNNALVNKINLDDTLTISICGHSDHSENGHINTLLAQAQYNSPLMEYVPTNEYVLTPIDSNTTNYIVFGGQILLNRLQAKTATAKYAGNGNNDYVLSQYTWDDLAIGCATDIVYTDEEGNDLSMPGYNRYTYNTIPVDGGYYYYTHKYDTVNPTDYQTILMHGFMGYDESKLYKYQYNADGSGHDNLTKLPVLCCELKVGDKYCCERVDLGEAGLNRFEWLTLAEWQALGINATGPFFTLGINPKIDDYIVGEKHDISNTVTPEMNLEDAKGTAIPIHYEDAIAGQMTFKILGVYNLTYNDVTHKTEHKWLFFGKKDVYTSNDRYILENLENILVYSFSCGVYSDNGGAMNNRKNKDMAYCSQLNAIFQNAQSEDTDIVTSLTSEEITADNLDVASISVSYVADMNNGLWKGMPRVVNNETVYDKPEERYTYGYYNEYYIPASIVNTNIKISDLYYIINPFIYRFQYSFKPARKYAVTSFDAGLKFNNYDMSTKEDLWT